MKFKIAMAIAAVTLAQSAYAQDAGEGEKIFKKSCRSCHMIVDDAGEAIVKGGKTGPNLYGVIGRHAGSEEGFRYKKSIEDAKDKGLIWDEATFEEYVQDPTGFLKSYLDDSGARSGMTFKLKDGMADVYAYLVSVAPPAE
ncbi:c-type cytochrome [Salipiger sp. P9]|uniref:c-type cytochrome n=1 Tax=Salipiger pentaromativorans TaxID=2943193 RepID=UPI0021574F02|nr:c-type cytochrome [Salipiger pentaromativorans]MCR8549529.1 c-type cytochrome [Salipiger pentaromativorans]